MKYYSSLVYTCSETHGITGVIVEVFLNGNCIPIASIIELPFTSEFFTNNSVPNVLINMVATHTTVSFTNFHLVENRQLSNRNQGRNNFIQALKIHP